MEWYHFWWCICTNYICTVIQDRCAYVFIEIYYYALDTFWWVVYFFQSQIPDTFGQGCHQITSCSRISLPVVFAKFIEIYCYAFGTFLIIFCLISVRNPWRITSSFWTRMTPSSTSIFGGGISMPVVFATIRRCVMSVKNCIAPTKKPKSTRQGHSMLQV